MEIKTERCLLRPFSIDNTQNLIDLHTNPQITETSNDGVQSEERIIQNLQEYIKHQKQYGYSQWVILGKENKAFMGRGGLTFTKQTKEYPAAPTLRIALLPENWNLGYAQECCKTIIEDGFERCQLTEIVAGSLNTNPRSRKMLENLEFKYKSQATWRGLEGAYFTINKNHQ